MSATRRIAYPLGLLVFLLPIAEGWTDALALASIASLLAERFVDLLGMDVVRHQTLFALSGSVFGVSLNCSGLSTLYSALLLVMIVGWRAGAGAWRMIALLALAAWPVTVVLNGLRVAFMIGGTQFWGITWVHSPIHGISGIAVFWAVMVIVAGIAWWLDAQSPAEAAVA
jgi:exosortase